MSLLLCISSQPWAREGHEWPSPGRLEHFQCFNSDTGSVSHQVKNSLYFFTLSVLYLLLSSAASRNGVLLMPPATKNAPPAHPAHQLHEAGDTAALQVGGASFLDFQASGGAPDDTSTRPFEMLLRFPQGVYTLPTLTATYGQ